MAKQLVKLEVAEVNEMYANEPEGKCYLLDINITEDDIEIVPQTGIIFHGVEDFFKVAMACKVNVYLATTLNREQNIAPCIRMF